MSMLDKCITALLNSQDKCEILSESVGRIISRNMIAMYPFAWWGPIDWDKVTDKVMIKEKRNIYDVLKKRNIGLNENVFIVWDSADSPIIKTSLKASLDNIDDITTIGFNTWLYCPTSGWILEFHHDDTITLGFAEKTGK
jgi:hypothetical protein